MPNNYFQFRKFLIQQEECTMKVCTDSCIFGAWLADKIENKIIDPARVLDIGTGTGLLPLMLAQKSNAIFDAIEIDKNCFRQAFQNFKDSNWNERIHAINQDIKIFESVHKYDLIITNPPFFKNQLKSDKLKNNLAKHEGDLTLYQVLISIQQNITSTGYAALLMPFTRFNECLELFKEAHMKINFTLKIKQTQAHEFFRVAFIISKNNNYSVNQDLTIKEGEKYTMDFIKLLDPYYLHLSL